MSRASLGYLNVLDSGCFVNHCTSVNMQLTKVCTEDITICTITVESD